MAIYIVAKEVLKSIDVYTLASLRGLVGGGMLLIVKPIPLQTWKSRAFALQCLLLGVLGFAVSQILFLKGLEKSHPIFAALALGWLPLFSGAIAMILKLERWTWNKYVGVGVCMACFLIYRLF